MSTAKRNAGGSVWAREAKPSSRREPLTRERIVATAIALADAEGLDAVSIRRIAGELQARPMSLYAHIESKDDLLALMHDEVVRETLLPEVPADWREAMRAIARATRASALRHPWIIAAFGEHPRMGPASLQHMDQSIAATLSLDADDATRRTLMLNVDTYTIGHVTLELAGTIRRRGSEDEVAAWREATSDYVRTRAADGDLPNLARIDIDALMSLDDADAMFEQGLDWLLAGATAASR